MRLVISDSKTGKTYQKELEKDKDTFIIGKKVGDEVDGGQFGLPGYTLEFTGGSDLSGFPMRKDIAGGRKVQALVAEPPGFRPSEKGKRERKTIRGNTYSAEIMQVNTKVKTAGATPLNEIFKKEEKPQEDAKK